MMKSVLDKKAKVVDVLVVGSGSYVQIIAGILASTKKTVHVVDDDNLPLVRCLKPGMYSVAGQCYQARHVVVECHPSLSIPPIRGLGKTPHYSSTSQLAAAGKKGGSVIIIAQSNDVFVGAFGLVAGGFSVEIVSADQRPLQQFDVSVSDYMKRTLKLAKIKWLDSAAAMSVINTPKGIYVVTDQGGAPKRLKADYLVVQPVADETVDPGFRNTDIAALQAGIVHAHVAYQKFRKVSYINPDVYLTLDDLSMIARRIDSKLPRRTATRHVPVHALSVAGIDYVTVGVAESALVSTHTAYNKAFVVIKDQETGKQSGFIKLLTHYTGKLVGISCVHAGAASFVPLWVEALKNRQKATSLLPLLTPSNPVSEAYLGALSEL